jgi:hypothetical protein
MDSGSARSSLTRGSDDQRATRSSDNRCREDRELRFRYRRERMQAMLKLIEHGSATNRERGCDQAEHYTCDRCVHSGLM